MLPGGAAARAYGPAALPPPKKHDCFKTLYECRSWVKKAPRTSVWPGGAAAPQKTRLLQNPVRVQKLGKEGTKNERMARRRCRPSVWPGGATARRRGRRTGRELLSRVLPAVGPARAAPGPCRRAPFNVCKGGPERCGPFSGAGKSHAGRPEGGREAGIFWQRPFGLFEDWTINFFSNSAAFALRVGKN